MTLSSLRTHLFSSLLIFSYLLVQWNVWINKWINEWMMCKDVASRGLSKIENNTNIFLIFMFRWLGAPRERKRWTGNWRSLKSDGEKAGKTPRAEDAWKLHQVGQWSLIRGQGLVEEWMNERMYERTLNQMKEGQRWPHRRRLRGSCNQVS